MNLKFIILIFLFTSLTRGSFAQMFENQEQISFGARMNAPVTVRVEQTGNTYVFYAENKSYYPYYFEINFDRLVNLKPITANEKRVLRHGSTRILKLTIENEEDVPDYRYSISYKMGDPSKMADENHPYLIPLSSGKKFERYSITSGNSLRYLINGFKIQSGDTIYAMRKGYIVSLPNNKLPIDKLVEGSIEIIHEDGTVAVYKNIDNPLLQYGDVLPGDPIGIVNKSEFVFVGVYFFTESKVELVDNKFVVDENVSASFKDLTPGLIVQHPPLILEKELTPKELKKFRKFIK